LKLCRIASGDYLVKVGPITVSYFRSDGNLSLQEIKQHRSTDRNAPKIFS
jgi:hypothetical protein